jgi:tRNA (adenine57-N1/adenine58-N1)-methyltransferase
MRKEERRLKQIETANRDKKRKRPEETSEGQTEEDAAKRAKVDSSAPELSQSMIEDLPSTSEATAVVPEPNPSNASDNAKISTKSAPKTKRTPHHPNAIVSATSDVERYIVSKPFGEVRGHTSYLTFAMLVPSGPRSGAAVGISAAANGAGPAEDSQDSNQAGRSVQSVEETSATFDSLIAGIPVDVSDSKHSDTPC